MIRIYSFILLTAMLFAPLGYTQSNSSFFGDILNNNFGTSQEEAAQTNATPTTNTNLAGLQENFDFALQVIGALCLLVGVVAVLSGSYLTALMSFIIFGICIWLFQTEPLLGLGDLASNLVEPIRTFIAGIIDGLLNNNAPNNGGSITS